MKLKKRYITGISLFCLCLLVWALIQIQITIQSGADVSVTFTKPVQIITQQTNQPYTNSSHVRLSSQVGCSVSCNASLFDYYANNTVPVIFDGKDTVTYTLPPSPTPWGQTAFVLNFVCQSKQTLFCSQSNAIHASQLLIVNTELPSNLQQDLMTFSQNQNELRNVIARLSLLSETVHKEWNDAKLGTLSSGWQKQFETVRQNATQLFTFNLTSTSAQKIAPLLPQSQALLSNSDILLEQFMNEVNAKYNLSIARQVLFTHYTKIANLDAKYEYIQSDDLLVVQSLHQQLLQLKAYENLIVQAAYTPADVPQIINRLDIVSARVQSSIKSVPISDFERRSSFLAAQQASTRKGCLVNISFPAAYIRSTLAPVFGYDTNGTFEEDRDLVQAMQAQWCEGFMLPRLNSNISSGESLQAIPLTSNLSRYTANQIKTDSELYVQLGIDSNIDAEKPIQLSANCCSYNSCGVCGKTQPVLLIPGHALSASHDPAVSMRHYAKIQYHLQESGYINGGAVTDLSDIFALHIPLPITFRSTYYYRFTVGNVHIQKTDRIENYALALRPIISHILANTNTSSLTLIAHSMGGLVARSYFDIYGTSTVSKFITVATPHQGIEGIAVVVCGILGARKECEDMTKGSIFLTNIQRANIPPTETIYASGCFTEGQVSDGVVLVSNTFLPGVNAIGIEGTCTDALGTSLHSEVLDVDAYPQTLIILRRLLKA